MNIGEEKYRELYSIGDGTRFVVKDETSGLLYVRKDEKFGSPEMYEFLKNHTNPHLCRINDYFDRSTHMTVYEEYVSGVNLEELMGQGGLRNDEVEDIILQLCDGLEFLHNATPPIVHRDLKLTNIMITESGVVKIIDFGAAKNIDKEKDRDTVLLGTPEYAAPEQYGFAPSDARTDIYALGVVLEKLAAKPMYENIIKKAKAIDPDMRYQSIAEFRKDFAGKSRKAPEEEKKPQRSSKLPGFRSGNKTNKVIGCIGYAMIIYLTIYNYYYNTEYTAPGQKICFAIITLVVQLGWVDALFDWTGIFGRVPGYRSEKPAIRFASRLFCCILSFSLWVIGLGSIMLLLGEIK